jgi:hypothetical protein
MAASGARRIISCGEPLMRVSIATALVCAAGAAAVGCADRAADERGALPWSGTAYRALSDEERLAVAADCRERAADTAGRVAAGELRRVDPRALRAELDQAFRLIRDQSRPVAEVCAKRLPFVTPGPELRFDGADGGANRFTYDTDSDAPLTIRGTMSPAPRKGAVVVARRAYEDSRPFRTEIGADGSFVLPTIGLRKIADNTFVLAIHAPPSALRKVYFSAICLDCQAAGPPPASRQ